MNAVKHSVIITHLPNQYVVPNQYAATFSMEHTRRNLKNVRFALFQTIHTDHRCQTQKMVKTIVKQPQNLAIWLMSYITSHLKSYNTSIWRTDFSKKQLRMASGTSKPTAMHLKMACFTCTQTQIRFVSLYMWILDLNNNFSLFMNSYHMACNMACFHGVEKDERDMKLNHFWVNCSSKPQMFPFECLFLKMVKI